MKIHRSCSPCGRTLVGVALALLLVASWSEAGDLRLPRLFSDGMVLQRERPIRVWGWAGPGQGVEVSLGDQAVRSTSDKSGRWEVLLPPVEAGGPWTLTVRGATTLTVKDVLVGDVWLASGQSNMEWTLGSGVVDQDQEIAAARFPRIRFFVVPRTARPEPAADTESGEWRPVTPETAEHVTAVGYFFARELHREVGVPIGIVSSAWGGTPAQAWTSAGMNLTLPAYRDRAREILRPGRNWAREMEEDDARAIRREELISDLDSALSSGPQLPGYDDGGWEAVRLPNDEALSDFVWLRRTFALKGPHKAGYTLRLGVNFPGVNAVFVNGRPVFHRNGNARTREVALPEGALQDGTNLVAVRALNGWNNQVFVGGQGPMEIRHGATGEVVDLAGEWRFNNTLEPPMPRKEWFSHEPSFLYNGMIAPIAGYTLTGAIWYQGESNAGQAFAYRTLFPTMIQDWRVSWRQGTFPFLFVQLANWRGRKPQPAASDWAELREAQLMALSLPETGMAVTIDIGEADDIHPRNKQDVGRRLALWARAMVYGDEVVRSGPLYRSMEIRGREIALAFDHVGGGLAAREDQPLTGFAVAGEDRQFAWAEARIEGDRVVVRSDLVSEPVAVRYAWADNPECNLVNAEGLPASPFRTDRWPGITE